jgi:hypothetical protein
LLSLNGALGKHFAEQWANRRRQFRPKQTHIGRVDTVMPQQLLQGTAVRERRLAGQHEIESAAERVDIAAHVSGPGIACLLRRNVIEGAQRHAASGQIVE